MMPYDFSTGEGQGAKAMELLVSIYDQIDTQFYDIKRPELKWKEYIPSASIISDVNPGAHNYGYRSRDFRGMGQFVRGTANNIPRVAQGVDQILVPMLFGAVGAEISDGDAMEYSYGFQASLASDLAAVMKKAAEYHVERCVFFGDDLAGFLPFLDYPTVTTIAGTAWSGTDATVWIQQIFDAIATQWSATKTLHIADTVILPIALATKLSRATVIGSTPVAMNAWEYLRTNSIYSINTGKPLNLKVLRYLDGNGVNGANRIILQDTNPENIAFPFPMAYQLAQPVPVLLGAQMAAMYKFGSFNLRYPMSMYYLDIPTS